MQDAGWDLLQNSSGYSQVASQKCHRHSWLPKNNWTRKAFQSLPSKAAEHLCTMYVGKAQRAGQVSGFGLAKEPQPLWCSVPGDWRVDTVQLHGEFWWQKLQRLDIVITNALNQFGQISKWRYFYSRSQHNAGVPGSSIKVIWVF